MRIITGTARGTKLKTLPGNDTRPTTEICKEAVFSVIQFELHDRVMLDLFGGCGQMALEALSRGAERAVIVDASRAACEIIKENAQKTKLMKQCRVVTSDWKEYIRGASGREKFDLVYLDPPYQEGILDEVMHRLQYSELLADDAIVICESDKNGIPNPIDGFRSKLYRYGKTYVTVFRRENGEEE
ncbi:MAG: 16S rRNA (guanine(966)-N(2))-methyltransferase RsmD [Clostridia bacterium]|nr:16S rRNA (guanine(966)-N(2))-methyltransferase RsmD [Clostridia bacterium]